MAIAILDRLFGKTPASLTTAAPRVSMHGTPKVAPEPTWGWKEGGPRPQGYILGVTPGATWTFYQPGGEYRAGLGLDRKIELASRMGFPFTMVDIESITEFLEDGLAERIKAIKDARNMDVGVHYPWEIELTDAKADTWRFWHKVLVMCTKGTAEIVKGKFGLIHLSYETRPDFIKRLGGESHLFSPEGTNLGLWIDEESKKIGFDLKDWFLSIAGEAMLRGIHVPGEFYLALRDSRSSNKFEGFLKSRIKEVANDALVQLKSAREAEDRARNIATKRLRELDDRLGAISLEIEKLSREAQQTPEKAPEINDKLVSLATEFKRIKEDNIPRFNFLLRQTEDRIASLSESIKSLEVLKPPYTRELMNLFATLKIDQKKLESAFEAFEWLTHYLPMVHEQWNYWVSRGAIATEIDAYHAVAKWMFIKKDKMWMSIVGNKDPDKIVDDAQKAGIVTPDLDKMVAAVAGKYIEGHLRASSRPEYMVPEGPIKNINELERDPEGFKAKGEVKLHTVYDYHKNNNVLIYLEINMPPAKVERRLLASGEVRLFRTTDAVKVCLAIDDGQWVNFVPDLEHMLLHSLNPIDEAEALIRENLPGRVITSMHINPPRPYMGLHAIINPISLDVITLFKIFKKFREAGMKDAILIWERGSEGPPRQSAEALRTIVKFLAADFAEADLPNEFYGLGDQFKAAQEVAIRERALAPIEGLMTFPEEEWTLLSSAAREKQKLDVWARERLR